jgi:hypothetical protein
MLAAGREGLRNVLAKVVRKAIARGCTPAGLRAGLRSWRGAAC